jgi:hypothetical protein
MIPEVYRMRGITVVLLAAVAIATAGCKKSDSAAKPPAGQPAAEAGAPAGLKITGKLLEKIEAPPYTYVKLKSDKGDVWAAVPKADVAVGSDVTVVDAMPMEKFESKTLKRTFDLVYFGSLPGAAGAPAGAGAMGGAAGAEGGPGMAAQHAMAATGPTDVGDVKVAKAAGADARSVSEVWSQRKALKDKPVTIRGKVVKFNPGIMGKNWIHLRDGSGTADKKDNDITITTADTVVVGDVVTAKGKVLVEKDFGAGYAYPVIIEDAKVAK